MSDMSVHTQKYLKYSPRKFVETILLKICSKFSLFIYIYPAHTQDRIDMVVYMPTQNVSLYFTLYFVFSIVVCLVSAKTSLKKVE